MTHIYSQYLPQSSSAICDATTTFRHDPQYHAKNHTCPPTLETSYMDKVLLEHTPSTYPHNPKSHKSISFHHNTSDNTRRRSHSEYIHCLSCPSRSRSKQSMYTPFIALDQLGSLTITQLCVFTCVQSLHCRHDSIHNLFHMFFFLFNKTGMHMKCPHISTCMFSCNNCVNKNKGKVLEVRKKPLVSYKETAATQLCMFWFNTVTSVPQVLDVSVHVCDCQMAE